MDNVKVAIDEKNVMTITVDLKKKGSPSKSGKTIVLASTRGNQSFDTGKGDVVIGVNVYKYPEEKK